MTTLRSKPVRQDATQAGAWQSVVRTCPRIQRVFKDGPWASR